MIMCVLEFIEHSLYYYKDLHKKVLEIKPNVRGWRTEGYYCAYVVCGISPTMCRRI